MKNKTLRSVLAIITLVLAATGGYEYRNRQEIAAPPDSSVDYHRVTRVVDGDTLVIDVDGQDKTVRLIGVDTPETVHPSMPVQHYGPEASTFLRNLAIGEFVWIEPRAEDAQRDRYHRLLAYVYRAPDGLHVNAEIIHQGYGKAYTKYPFDKSAEFEDLQHEAREYERGLWEFTE